MADLIHSDMVAMLRRYKKPLTIAFLAEKLRRSEFDTREAAVRLEDGGHVEIVLDDRNHHEDRVMLASSTS